MKALRLLVALLLLTASGAGAALPPWVARVEAPPDPAAIVAPRSFKASYRIAWSGLSAAHAEVECTAPPNSGEVHTRLTTATTGMARSLWQMDAVHLAVADARTMRPIRIEETDKRDDKVIATTVDFSPGAAVRSTQTVRPDGTSDPAKAKPKRFAYPHLLDMHSALLSLRDVPLAAGETHVVLVMTVTNPYLVTIKSAGPETVELKSGSRRAIRCSVALNKVGKTGELQAQKRFKSATVWISDDPDRTLLKVEAKVFVGTVVLELEQLAFTDQPAV